MPKTSAKTGSGQRRSRGGKRVTVLYQDKHLMVVHKPSGFLVYGEEKNSKIPTCYDLVKRMVGPDRDVFPVHRIDRGTCGTLMFALTSQAASLLLRDFKQGKIHKTYWAFVFGRTSASGDLREPLSGNKSKEKQSAQTKFRRLGFAPVPELSAIGDPEDACYVSWIECDPKTGRYHQIRRHLKGAGHALLGDEEYGGEKRARFAAEYFGIRRVALSAVAISFTHPITRREFVIETNPDDALETFRKSIEWKKS